MAIRIELDEGARLRFLSKFDPLDINEDVCWEWKGTTFANGYAAFWLNGQNQLASRVSFGYFLGNPEGWCVCHECDNPNCVNPRHLFLGTHNSNMADMYSKGRGGKRHGIRHPSAKLSEEQVRTILKSSSVGASELGRRFGVAESAIRLIRTGVNWKHVAREVA